MASASWSRENKLGRLLALNFGQCMSTSSRRFRTILLTIMKMLARGHYLLKNFHPCQKMMSWTRRTSIGRRSSTWMGSWMMWSTRPHYAQKLLNNLKPPRTALI